MLTVSSNKLSCIPVLMMFFIWLGGCASGGTTTSSTTEAAKSPVVSTSSNSSRASWQQRWDSTLAEAKKEGTVTLYVTWKPDTRIALTSAFKEKYGINLEFTPFSRGDEMVAKANAEKTAGLYFADAFGTGGSTLLIFLKPARLLGPMEPSLILPEVLDDKLWSGNHVPFFDKDKQAIGMIGAVQQRIIYNTDQVRKGEIVSYKDLLKPQYKGKITINDPTVTGAGSYFFAELAYYIWNTDQTKEFLRQLIKQDMVLQRDPRVHVESVARGKFAIGLAAAPDTVAEFMTVGAPIDSAFASEGTMFAVGTGAIGLADHPAHPNATVIFINWLLSKEGQTVLSKAMLNPSLRSDVPTEGILPIFLPKPDQKLYYDLEEFTVFTGQWSAIARQMVEGK